MPIKTDYKPRNYTDVTPWIITRDTGRLLEFLVAAFGADELARVPNPNGRGIGHAEARIGDAIVLGFDSPDGWPTTPAFLRLYVESVDATFAAAVAAGAGVITVPTLLGFGDVVARVRDPLGNVWWLQAHVEDVSPEEMQRRWTEPRWAEAMTYVQSSLAEAMPAV